MCGVPEIGSYPRVRNTAKWERTNISIEILLLNAAQAIIIPQLKVKPKNN